MCRLDVSLTFLYSPEAVTIYTVYKDNVWHQWISLACWSKRFSGKRYIYSPRVKNSCSTEPLLKTLIMTVTMTLTLTLVVMIMIINNYSDYYHSHCCYYYCFIISFIISYFTENNPANNSWSKIIFKISNSIHKSTYWYISDFIKLYVWKSFVSGLF